VLTVNEHDLIGEVDHIGRRAWSRMIEQHPDVSFPLNLSPPPPPIGGLIRCGGSHSGVVS
jgi:hypothetical protein